MPDSMLVCPHCGRPVELTTALRHQLEAEISQSIKAAHAKEFEAEKRKIWAIAQQEAEKKNTKEFLELKERSERQSQQLKEFESQELELRKKQREFEDAVRRQELDVQRRVDKEREKLLEELKQQELEKEELKQKQADSKVQEKELENQQLRKQLEQMNKTVEDLRRKSEQGSMQVQGDAAESAIKERLSAAFPKDRIDDVATGRLGADLTQFVMGNLGNPQGVILWEIKQTQVFSQQWLTKLKKDQMEAKADIAVLVTAALPKHVVDFGEENGIWIVSPQHCVALASALRSQLIALSHMKESLVDKDVKSQQLYTYFAGVEFKNRIEQLVMTYVQMQKELQRERQALKASMSRREKQLENMLMGTAGLYGDLQGMIGGALPRVEQLELEGGDEISLTVDETTLEHSTTRQVSSDGAVVTERTTIKSTGQVLSDGLFD